jgi:hypothetical protein
LLQALHSQNKRAQDIKSPKNQRSKNAKTPPKKNKTLKIEYFVKKKKKKTKKK